MEKYDKWPETKFVFSFAVMFGLGEIVFPFACIIVDNVIDRASFPSEMKVKHSMKFPALKTLCVIPHYLTGSSICSSYK